MTTKSKATQADRDLTHAAAEKRDEPVVRVLGFVSEAADQLPLTGIVLATIATGAALGRPALVRGGVRMLIAHGIAAAMKTAIKRTVDRARPEHAIESGDERFDTGGTDDHDLNSFPSGHTAGAVAVSRALAVDLPSTAVPGMMLATAVAAIQLPRGKHYIGDVLAGAAVGWVAARAASELLDPVFSEWDRRRS